MDHPFTLINVTASLFSTHLVELIVMLTGSIVVGFVAGKLLVKGNKTEKEITDETTEDVSSTTQVVNATTILINGKKPGEEEVAIQKEWETRENELQLQLEQRKQQMQQHQQEFNSLIEENKALILQINQLYDCLKTQQQDLAAVAELQTVIKTQGERIDALQEEKHHLNVQIDDFKAELVNTRSKYQDIELPLIDGLTIDELSARARQYQLELQQTATEKLELQEQSDILKQQISTLETSLMAAQTTVPGNISETERPMVTLLQEKMQLLQKERNNMIAQIAQLENQLKITHLTSLSRVEMEQEEENPFKRLTLYVRMLEGEKQGLNNKILDLTKRLQQSEAGMAQIEVRDNELSYLKARINALEKDKRDVESQSVEWEIMYKKLQEKTHYLLSSKETELEQQKTMNSYLEKDKARLQGRINDLENELRSSLFTYKGKTPQFVVNA
jgi:chromosome segregation ATPase